MQGHEGVHARRDRRVCTQGQEAVHARTGWCARRDRMVCT